MKAKSPLGAVFLIMFIAMAGINLFLVVQNVSYGRENRDLILKNDSILSVNLDMANELNRLSKIPHIREGKVHGPQAKKR